MRSRRPAVKKKTSESGPGRWVRAFVSVAWRPFLVWVLPVASLVVACLAGLQMCRSHVRESAWYQVVAPELSLLPQARPPWWEKAFEDQVYRSCAFAEGASMLDGTLPRRIAETCQRCPWVRRVQWVGKRFPNRVCAEIDLRLAGAAVAVQTGRETGYYLVGDDGIALPKVYRSWPQPGLGVPLIVGVRAAPPSPGAQWSEQSVADALRIVGMLRSRDVIRKAVNITAVDVSNYRGRVNKLCSEFLVVAQGNCVIEWGRAPGSDRPGELPVAEKLAKFERFLAEGNPTGDRTLDLRFAGRVVVSRRVSSNGNNG